MYNNEYINKLADFYKLKNINQIKSEYLNDKIMAENNINQIILELNSTST